MSVWVEILLRVCLIAEQAVTLHVSVWVEMCRNHVLAYKQYVTLHVSVWVEILNSLVENMKSESRSTWACELKWTNARQQRWRDSHAPRERVSWNPQRTQMADGRTSHAPRERVSWNRCLVIHFYNNLKSRSTWACELKFSAPPLRRFHRRSRSTWACELKLFCTAIIAILITSRSTWACELK